ncbi:MAG: TRAP transporter small permease [Salinicola sp.]|uniref:TRAP transporter small permease n=1 Tax=Salinicola sp. TaxID=1978524 RepID=UPI001D69E478|nr:TRAP transporter small permease [Salinicola sp.]NRB57797.1 TRAP transporter small permease [Salinicola sp.]
MSDVIAGRPGEPGHPGSPPLRLKTAIHHLFKWLGILSLLVMFATLLAAVFVRYVWETNLDWTSEVPNILFPWLTMCAIVATAAKNEHIGIEAVVERLPRPLRRVIGLATNLLAAVAFALIAWHGLEVVAIAGSQRLPITGIAMSWSYWSVVVGFAGLALVSLINVLVALDRRVPVDESLATHGEEAL